MWKFDSRKLTDSRPTDPLWKDLLPHTLTTEELELRLLEVTTLLKSLAEIHKIS